MLDTIVEQPTLEVVNIGVFTHVEYVIQLWEMLSSSRTLHSYKKACIYPCEVGHIVLKDEVEILPPDAHFGSDMFCI